MSDDPAVSFRAFRDRGDAAALADVFDRAAPSLLRLGRRLLGDEAAAEDLVQQTFLTAMRRAGSFRDGAPLLPWLCGILGRHARNEWRRRRRAAAAEVLVRRAAPIEARSPSS